MKAITITDKDYELLMELSKELQLQENDCQAFPYFWHPISTKDGIGTEDDTPILYDNNAADTITVEQYAEDNPELFKEYLYREGCSDDEEFSEIDVVEFAEYVCYKNKDLQIFWTREEEVNEPNFSLFKSDVTEHIAGNRHHLGENPRTYARTFFRMRRMEQLLRILYRLNHVPEDKCNHEALNYRNV